MDGILSRTLFQDDRIKAVVIGVAQGQVLSERTAAKPAMLLFVQARRSTRFVWEESTPRKRSDDDGQTKRIVEYPSGNESGSGHCPGQGRGGSESRGLQMSVSDEERRNAERTGELVGKKLLEIMELQGDIDALLRDKHPTPFGPSPWQYASLEAMQRIVAMTAIQFVLFEPVGRVKGNDDFKVAADRIIEMMLAQLKTLKTKKSDW